MNILCDYQPISCIDHERLEFAVLKRQKLRLSFRDEAGEVRTLTVLPTDVTTRDKAEWLSYRPEGEVAGEKFLRLDRILRAEPEGQ